MSENPVWGRGLQIGSVMALTLLLLAATVAGAYQYGVKFVNSRTREALDQQWAAMKGYLRIEDGVHWYYDDRDPDASQMVRRLQSVFFLADQNGRVIDEAGGFPAAGAKPSEIGDQVAKAIQASSPGKPIWLLRRGFQGRSYLVRAGILYDDRLRTPYYAAIAAPLSLSRQTLDILTGAFVAALACAFAVGWLAGRLTSRVST